jgi:hypothetical protein
MKPAPVLVLAALGTLATLALHGGCGDDEAADDKRRGGLGEACQKTDDCVAPLLCIGLVCTDGSGGSAGDGGTAGSPSTGGGGSGASGGMGGVGGMGGGAGEGGSVPSPFGNACDSCLRTTCGTELAACGDGCFSIEGCIETYCRSPSLDAAQESNCFVTCQNLYTQKQQHIDVAVCSAEESCDGCIDCLYQPDHTACVDYTKTGPCLTEWNDCTADSACTDFQACVSTCATAADCFACDDAAPLSADKYEAYERCAAEYCVLTSWISVICG